MTGIQRVFLRADGGTKIGSGHLSRLTALAAILKQAKSSNFKIHFYVNQAFSTDFPCMVFSDPSEENQLKVFKEIITPEDKFVLDGYHFSERYHQELSKLTPNFYYVDDLNEQNFFSHIIHPNEFFSEGDYQLPSGKHAYCGLSFALVDPSFFSSHRSLSKSSNRIGIVLGGADPENHSLEICSGLLAESGEDQVSVFCGQFNPHCESLLKLQSQTLGRLQVHVGLSKLKFIDQLKECRVLVCAASTISFEACALQIPIVFLQTAENQKYVFHTLKNRKLGLDGTAHVVKSVQELLSHDQLYSEITANQQRLIHESSFHQIQSIFSSDFRS